MDNLTELVREYEELELNKVLNYEKFNNFSIVHHSSSIEGSTLTEVDTQLLLDEGITPAGKPLVHSLMVKDHYAALLFMLTKFPERLSVSFIQEVNAKVMSETGQLYETAFGKMDASKGEFRKGNVTAGGSYFPNYDKVERLTKELVEYLNEKLTQVKTLQAKLELSFYAHYTLVSIHPFYDGNGRTSRLLMNGIQHKFGLPLSIVFKEDKSQYYDALIESREDEDIEHFYDFMFSQYEKQLKQSIAIYKKGLNRDSDFFFNSERKNK